MNSKTFWYCMLTITPDDRGTIYIAQPALKTLTLMIPVSNTLMYMFARDGDNSDSMAAISVPKLKNVNLTYTIARSTIRFLSFSFLLSLCCNSYKVSLIDIFVNSNVTSKLISRSFESRSTLPIF